MATTTNFGWETPDDTDLVKDGALAIRTLGNSIDTSLVDLKGGTTGQVLSKTSNTDMDFTWVTSDDANAIQNAIVDAKGDLIAASAADTPARLAVGNNGETLVADSSASVGLRYQEPKAGNPVVNSAFQVWQRGTSVSLAASTPSYTADRWYVVNGANQATTVSRQSTNDTTNLPFIQYCARLQRNSGQTGTGTMSISQPFETINSVPFAGKTVTLSYYARKGADFSSATSSITIYLATGTGTDQNQQGAGYTGQALPISSSATLTTTWQRFTHTATLATNITEIQPIFTFTPVGTAGANDWFEITGVQVEVGSVATPFRTQGVTLAGEFQAASRYYQRFTNTSSNALYAHGGINTSSTRSFHYVALQTAMRTSPSVAEVGAQVGDTVGSNLDITAISVYTVANNSISLDCTHASGYSASAPLFLVLPQNAYLELSAEL